MLSSSIQSKFDDADDADDADDGMMLAGSILMLALLGFVFIP